MIMKIFKRLDRGLETLITSSNALASVWVFLMMIGVVGDVLGRFLFNTPIVGTTEMVTVSIVSVLYLQLAFTLRSGTMTRSEAVISRLVKNSPRIGYTLNCVFSLAGLLLMIAIMSMAWPKSIDAYENSFYVGVAGVFTFPDWPRLCIVFIGCGLTGAQFLFFAARDIVFFFNPKLAE